MSDTWEETCPSCGNIDRHMKSHEENGRVCKTRQLLVLTVRCHELEAENKRLKGEVESGREASTEMYRRLSISESTLAQVREWEENTLMKKARREALLNILSTDTRRKEVT